MVDQLAVDARHQIGRGDFGKGLLRADRETGLAKAA
jgi:hypothetical protein